MSQDIARYQTDAQGNPVPTVHLPAADGTSPPPGYIAVQDAAGALLRVMAALGPHLADALVSGDKDQIDAIHQGYRLIRTIATEQQIWSAFQQMQADTQAMTAFLRTGGQ